MIHPSNSSQLSGQSACKWPWQHRAGIALFHAICIKIENNSQHKPSVLYREFAFRKIMFKKAKRIGTKPVKCIFRVEGIVLMAIWLIRRYRSV